jgi:pimeloyl-ACP methyl ester carboxylesterase
MRHLTRDGVKLAYEDAGSGSPPIVFVHGWTCNHTYFAPQAAHFGERHRVVSVDLRGHGQSDKPDGPYSIGGFADDVAWLCGQLRLDHPVVVGHSMGGMVAVELAARYPNLPSAVVACDSPLVPAAPLMAAIADTAAKFHQAVWRPAHRAFLEQMLFIATDDPKRRDAILADMTSAPDAVTIGCFDAIAGANSEGAVAGCTVPFLYIAAAAILADFAKLRQLCPKVVTGQTVGAGHFHQLEVPDQVNAMIERFLALSLNGRPAER